LTGTLNVLPKPAYYHRPAYLSETLLKLQLMKIATMIKIKKHQQYLTCLSFFIYRK